MNGLMLEYVETEPTTYRYKTEEGTLIERRGGTYRSVSAFPEEPPLGEDAAVYDAASQDRQEETVRPFPRSLRERWEGIKEKSRASANAAATLGTVAVGA